MASLENEIALLLQANSVGTLGTNLFYGGLPDSPDSCVSVLSPTGNGSIHASATIQYVSTLVRGKDYTATGVIADAIYLLLHNQQNLLSPIAGAAHIVGFSRSEHLPRYIGRDPQGRCVWSITNAMNVSAL